jgi:hypothetical protein
MGHTRPLKAILPEHRERSALMVAARAVDRALAQHEADAAWLNAAEELVAELATHLRAE